MYLFMYIQVNMNKNEDFSSQKNLKALGEPLGFHEGERQTGLEPATLSLGS